MHFFEKWTLTNMGIQVFTLILIAMRLQQIQLVLVRTRDDLTFSCDIYTIFFYVSYRI